MTDLSLALQVAWMRASRLIASSKIILPGAKKTDVMSCDHEAIVPRDATGDTIASGSPILDRASEMVIEKLTKFPKLFAQKMFIRTFDDHKLPWRETS